LVLKWVGPVQNRFYCTHQRFLWIRGFDVGPVAASGRTSSFRLLPEWLAANTLTGAIFVFLSTLLGELVLAKLLVFGAIFTLGQWIVLRRYYDTSWAWLVVPIFGALTFVFGALGGDLVSVVSPTATLAYQLLSGAVAGAFIGSVQAALLRPKLRRPVLLIVSTCIAGAFSAKYWVDALGSAEAPLWGAFGGAVYGLVTGLALLADRVGADNPRS
jgi:hypothetical protein